MLSYGAELGSLIKHVQVRKSEAKHGTKGRKDRNSQRLVLPFLRTVPNFASFFFSNFNNIIFPRSGLTSVRKERFCEKSVTSTSRSHRLQLGLEADPVDLIFRFHSRAFSEPGQQPVLLLH